MLLVRIILFFQKALRHFLILLYRFYSLCCCSMIFPVEGSHNFAQCYCRGTTFFWSKWIKSNLVFFNFIFYSTCMINSTKSFKISSNIKRLLQKLECCQETERLEYPIYPNLFVFPIQFLENISKNSSKKIRRNVFLINFFLQAWSSLFLCLSGWLMFLFCRSFFKYWWSFCISMLSRDFNTFAV